MGKKTKTEVVFKAKDFMESVEDDEDDKVNEAEGDDEDMKEEDDSDSDKDPKNEADGDSDEDDKNESDDSDEDDGEAKNESDDSDADDAKNESDDGDEDDKNESDDGDEDDKNESDDGDEDDGEAKNEADGDDEDKDVKEECDDLFGDDDDDVYEGESEDEEAAKEEALTKVLQSFNVPADSVPELRAVLQNAVKEHANVLARKLAKNASRVLLERYKKLVDKTEAKAEMYVSRAVKDFAKKNKKQLRDAAKVEAYAGVITGIVRLLAEHQIDISPDISAVKENYEKKLSAANKKVDSLLKDKASLEMKIEGHKIANSIRDLTKGFTETDTARFVDVVGSLQVKDHADFLKKAESVKTKLFSESKTKTEKEVEVFVESFSKKTARDLGIGGKEGETKSVFSAAIDVLSHH